VLRTQVKRTLTLPAGYGAPMRPSLPIALLVFATACTRQPAEPKVSFKRDVQPELTRGCASAEGCHGSAPTDSVSLDLRPAESHAQLVGVDSEGRPGTARVTPGAPDASFLLDKLRGTLRQGEGKSMPIDAETGAPIVPSPLPPGYVERVLVRWIAEGAKDN
jgi:hypothetical protein